MVVKKFHGATTREVLKQVRDELGPDALILSNRQLPDGNIEIMAVADTEVAALAGGAVVAKPAARPAAQPPRAPAAANKAVQRTYALPPELDDDEEPTLDDVRPMPQPAAPRQAAPRPGAQNQATPGQPAPRAAAPRPSAPMMMAAPRVGGDVLPDDHPGPAATPGFSPRYRYEPPEEDLPPPAGQRLEPTLGIPPAALPQAQPMAEAPRAAEPPLLVETVRAEPARPAEAPAPMRPEAAEQGRKIDSISQEVEDISGEIKLLRSLLEGQLAGLAWNELKRHAPERLEVLRRLLSVGFSPALSRQIVEHMPAGYSTERGMKWARTALQHNLPTVGPGADIVEAGGVYALVGPTGVGKTTTVAKLAARATLKHGAARVALITTDGYRIGAQDQLRIYGKILGVPVYAVTDETDLAQTLADLRNRHMVLIDTVGMSQRDQRVVEQIALLAGQTTPVKRLLLLSANAQGTTLDDVVRRYHGEGLSGCIFTKTDEAFSLGSGLDVIIRYKLPLYYITNGQRVPEDLHMASSLYLVDRVFKTPPEAPAYRLKHEEYPLFMGAQAPSLDFSWREAAGG
ncbi:flagellar biosynthesis protein FlhF [Chitinimonas koreensis]|uniref:flagellar biosynthesis protein FlhF n=1 Tax=Chitinimonas koreensis TaxID=356302 RepID=UPI0003FE718D|nr:flagellar biosynthesis protein FlhF [Chitinimonas koreensis]